MQNKPTIYFNDLEISRTRGGFSIELIRTNNQSENRRGVGTLYMSTATVIHLSTSLRKQLLEALEEMCEGSEYDAKDFLEGLERRSQKHLDLVESLLVPDPQMGFHAPKD